MPKQNVAGFFIVLFCGGCATWDPPANQPSGIAIGIQEIADPEDPTSEGLIPDQKKRVRSATRFGNAAPQNK